MVIRRSIERSLFLKSLVAFRVVPLGIADRYLLGQRLTPAWKRRLEETVACSDNDCIPRVSDAGQVHRGKQVMHNGLKIHLGSYYGPEVAQILRANRGVHEPQEERVFQEVLPTLKPGSVMIELGAFWGFYSMWFNSVVENASNFLVEPEAFNIQCGIRNFRLNGMRGDFTRAFVGECSDRSGSTPAICVDDFVSENGIGYVDILHSDIQGYEFDMLQGAQRTFEEKRVGFVFVSTHSNPVHNECLRYLKSRGFFIIANADLDQTYSEDGLIAACSPETGWSRAVPISLKRSGS